MEWHHVSFPKKKKACIVTSVGKVTGTVFWDREGCLLVDFPEHSEHMKSEWYAAILKKLCWAIHENWPHKQHVILQHDNVCPHVAQSPVVAAEEYNWELLPTHSPDLAPSDYHLLGYLKDARCRTYYMNDNAVRYWSVQTIIYHDVIFKLVECWQKCVATAGDFIVQCPRTKVSFDTTLSLSVNPIFSNKCFIKTFGMTL